MKVLETLCKPQTQELKFVSGYLFLGLVSGIAGKAGAVKY
jgi:hypothetical protein